MTGQPHAAHDVDFEQSLPRLVGFLEKPDRLVDAEVIDQNLDLGPPRDGLLASGGSAIIGYESESSASGRPARTSAMALSTLAGARPLMMTLAPSAASERAISRPMPPEEAVTNAVLPFRSSFTMKRRCSYRYRIAHQLSGDRGCDSSGLMAVPLGRFQDRDKSQTHRNRPAKCVIARPEVTRICGIGL